MKIKQSYISLWIKLIIHDVSSHDLVNRFRDKIKNGSETHKITTYNKVWNTTKVQSKYHNITK